jgi:hypothetical protein
LIAINQGQGPWHALRNLLGTRSRETLERTQGEAMDQAKMKIAYVVTQRGTNKYWTRVGAAFVNRDGSINVKLEAIPVSGEIHVRDYVPREDNATLLGHKNGNGNGQVDDFVETA